MRINAERVKEAPAQALRAVFAGIGQLLLAVDKMRKRGADPENAAPGGEPATAAGPTAPASETAGTARATAGTGRATARAPRPERPAPEPIRSTAPAADPARGSASRPLERSGNVRLLTPKDPRPAAPPAAPITPAAPATPAAETGPPAAAGPAAGRPETETLAAASTPTLPEAAFTEAATEDLTLEVPKVAVPGAAIPEAGRSAGGLAEADLPVPNYDALSVPSLRARLRSLDAAQVGVLAEYERSHAARADVVAMLERRIAKLAAGG